MKTTITRRALASLRGISATFLSVVALGAWLAPQAGNAQPAPVSPYQSLVDNFVSPHCPLTYRPLGLAVTREKGEMILSDPYPVFPPYLYLGLSQVGIQGSDIFAADTSMRVVTRLNDSSTWLGLYTRFAGGDAYTCNLLPDGTLLLRKFSDPPGTARAFAFTSLDPVNRDVVVEYDTIGDTIRVKAWALDDPGVIYSTSWEDPNPRPPGFLGLGVVGLGAGGSDASVTFQQFKLKVIPPTSERE